MNKTGIQLGLFRFVDIDVQAWLALLNDADVNRYLPLATTPWDAAAVRQWMADKDAQWADHGYGPWALRIDGRFAGWGGFQKEAHGADLALVLHRAFWGAGPAVCRAMLAQQAALGIERVSLLLPPERPHLRGLARLGFHPVGELTYDGCRFLHFVRDDCQRPTVRMPASP
ncbi:GCN5-like N-acetyltransferase [Alcanivorax sp. S71-1-4]|jgi:RimJ/RimL family protein N-acetyltransferase|uniref:GNAT family N-acetyltransferase n=1 Tax=Alcanivorax sp. S71-1-4 TaxID=1177159 RepID=UPI0016B6E4CA|nr:GNAT family protein [Alcanivorax sp. S71-1-4]KAF0805964.1 GCN5-like N-acetyltransferase [Alcanivorax sp. S71-1-4]